MYFSFIKVNILGRVVLVQALHPTLWEFETSLLYRVSSRTSYKATKKKPYLKKTKQSESFWLYYILILLNPVIESYIIL